MALLGSLVDNFCAPTLDTSTWNAVNSAGNTGFQAGCRYTFIVSAGMAGDATLTTDVAYDLTGSHVHVELIDAGVQEAGLETYPIILTEVAANQDDSLLIVVSNGLVGIYEFNGGVPNGLAFPTYDPVAMRWWRIRESGGTVYYESAPDVRGPWTVQASVVPTVNITALFMKIRTLDFLALSTAKQTAVSNVNYLAPPDVPFPNGALPVGMEIAFGADIYGDQSAWGWTDVTPPDAQSYFMSQEVTTTRGRPDESSDVAPTSANIQLDNPNGDFTPYNAMSQYYPNVDLGTPARWWVRARTPRLLVNPVAGARAEVSSTSSLDITSDLDLRIDMHMRTTSPGGFSVVPVSRAQTGTTSWRVIVLSGHQASLQWSTNGTSFTDIVTSNVPVVPSSARSTLRITLDVNNGSGGHEVKFWIGDSVNGPFTQIDSTHIGAGTTSINNAAADLSIGAHVGLTPNFEFEGDVYAFQLLQGIGGSAIVDVDFSAQTSGVSQFVDATGLLWIMQGDVELTDVWYRIVGTVDSWAPVWPWGDLSSQQDGGLGEGQARTDLEIAGVLRRLGQGQAPLDSPLRRATQAGANLRAYWPMEDGDEATQFASAVVGGTPMVIGGNIQPSSNDLLPGSKPLPELGSTSFFSGAVVGSFSGHWRIDFYLYIPSSTPNQVFFMRATGDGTVKTWLIDTSAGNVGVTGLDSSGTSITSGSASGVDFFDHWVNVQLVAVQNGADIDWDLTWFPIQYPTHAGWTFGATLANATVGGITAVAFPADADVSDISTGHWSVLDEGGVNFPSNAAMGWTGDTAVERMARLCDEQGLMFRVIGAPSESARMGVQSTETLLSLLNDAADVDGGILYEMPRNIGLIYRTQRSLYNQPPNMTMNALQGELANPFAPVRDDQRIRNVVTVTRRDGGSSPPVIDEASIAQAGIYDEAVTLNLFQDTQTPDAAGWRLHQGTVESMRYAQVTTNLGVAPEMIDDWLTIDSGSRIHITNLPPQHPTGTVDLTVEGYSEPISPTTWMPTVNATPGQIWDVAELDGDWVADEYLLRLDTDGSELDADIDDNDTTFEVLVTAGPDWVTDASELPLDIRVGGERMTVTDIDPEAGGTQQFTVTRSVNGVVKPHAAGTAVELWFQPVLAR